MKKGGKQTQTSIDVEYIAGNDLPTPDLDAAKKLLEMADAAAKQIEPVQKFIRLAREAATSYALSNDVDVIQLEESYWRKIQRHSKFWVALPDDMPANKPKGAKSLKEICKGKRAGEKSLWNFITRRVPEPARIDLAVKRGYVTEKEISKAFIETPQKPFLQQFQGEAIDAEDED